MPGFEELDHTADWAFRARGRELGDLFANAARAMFALDGGAGAPGNVAHEVHVEAIDRETLLVNWLNELLYLSQTRGELYEQFDILEIDAKHLRARVSGHPRADTGSRVKAATFHDLQVKQTASGWEAVVVLDV